MDLFTRRQLDELLAVHVEPCISIYLPTHRTAPETAQDPIRFKNTLRAVNRELEQAGLISREIREQTKAVESWLHDADFWRHQSDGLAVFLTSEVLKRFRLPRSFPELYRIDNHFYVNPLLPLLQTNGTFYILAVSQNACRLFTGNPLGLPSRREHTDVVAPLRLMASQVLHHGGDAAPLGAHGSGEMRDLHNDDSRPT